MPWRFRSVEMHFLCFFPKGHCLPWEVEAQQHKSPFRIFWSWCGRHEPWPRMTNILFACLTFLSVLFSSNSPNSDRSPSRLSVSSVLPPLFSTSVCFMLSNTSLTHVLNFQFFLISSHRCPDTTTSGLSSKERVSKMPCFESLFFQTWCFRSLPLPPKTSQILP